MTEEPIRMDQLEVRVKGVFTSHHEFLSEAGQWGVLTMSAFSRRAVFETSDGRELVARSTSWLRSRYEFSEAEQVRGTAQASSLLSRQLTVHFDGQEHRIVPEGLLRRGWTLTDAQGSTLLEIRPRGILRMGSYVTITGPVEADLIPFAYYLVYQRQQQEQ